MHPHFRVLLVLALLILTGSTVFFRFVEGWSWIDAYFFTVVTVSTVGYGSIVPVTVLGKIGTTVLIFLGIGVIAVALNMFGAVLVAAHTERTKAERAARKERRRLGKAGAERDQTDI
jgi:voltage-gated potassium channel